jgi:hypothetical protein
MKLKTRSAMERRMRMTLAKLAPILLLSKKRGVSVLPMKVGVVRRQNTRCERSCVACARFRMVAL